MTQMKNTINIYVGNLSLGTTEEELRREFSRFGEVDSVTIMNDKYIGSGQTKGYGYVQMCSKENAANAIAGLEGTMLNDHVIKVVAALPMTKNELKENDHSGRAMRINKNRVR
jgi:RNA recognition motif-containing protein